MRYNKKYTKEEAINAAKKLIKEVNIIEDEFGMSFNSDTNIYLTFKSNDVGKVWDYVSLGWVGDGTPIRVIEEEKMREALKQKALNKLTEEERELLGL